MFIDRRIDTPAVSCMNVDQMLRWKISLGMRLNSSLAPDTNRRRSHVSSICSSRMGIQPMLASTRTTFSVGKRSKRPEKIRFVATGIDWTPDLAMLDTATIAMEEESGHVWPGSEGRKLPM